MYLHAFLPSPLRSWEIGLATGDPEDTSICQLSFFLTLLFGTLTLPKYRTLLGTAFVGYLFLIVSRSAALSYFAIYLAAG